jgi:hypothetical protein
MTNQNTTYNAMDRKAWNENDSRQRELTNPDAIIEHTVLADDVVAGDAVYDKVVRCWRGVYGTRDLGDCVEFVCEDGGRFNLNRTVKVLRSETGLLGWSSGAVATAAFEGR